MQVDNNSRVNTPSSGVYPHILIDDLGSGHDFLHDLRVVGMIIIMWRPP